MSNIDITKNIQKAYDDQYSEKMTEWRELGGKYKAQNIIKLSQGKTFSKVLDYGAGEGSILKYLDDHEAFNSLYAVEISDSGINQIKNRNLSKLKEVTKFDGYKTTYADNEFDLVYCSHVIEHVEHPRLVLREIKRISKFQIFEIPLDYFVGVDNQIEHFLDYGHISIYTPSLFKFLLKSEGYNILNEIHSNPTSEVIKYNWYHNMKLQKTIKRELFYELSQLKSKFKKAITSKQRSQEFGFTAYTCLSDASGEVKIF